MGQHPEDGSAVLGAREFLVRRKARKGPDAYVLTDREGIRLGGVFLTEIRRKGAVRMVTNFVGWTDSRPGVRLDVADRHDGPLFSVVFAPEDKRDRATVEGVGGEILGEFVKARGFRKIHFDLRAAGTTLGSVEAEGLTGWEYRVVQAGAPVGRITSIFEKVLGLPTTTDDHLVELDKALAEPFRTLVWPVRWGWTSASAATEGLAPFRGGGGAGGSGPAPAGPAEGGEQAGGGRVRSSTAASKAGASASDGERIPDSLRTYWTAASRTSRFRRRQPAPRCSTGARPQAARSN